MWNRVYMSESMILKTMKQLTHMALLWAVAINLGISQTVPIDEIDWTTQSGTSGSTINGVFWSATGSDQDGSGTFGVVGNQFVFEDTEGSQACPCGTSDTPPCGNNDNTLLIDPIPIINYCEVNVSFSISLQGNLKCGDLDDQDPVDVNVASCPSDNGAQWAGTDALEVTIMTIETGEIRTISLCGSQSSTGTLDIDETFDVGDLGTAIMITVIGGTQQGGSYQLNKIEISGLPRINTSINLELGGRPANNQVCVGQGFFELNTGIADANSEYIWAFPDGSTTRGNLASGHDVLTVNDITPANSGTYRVTVVDENLCELTESIDVSVLESTDPECQSRASFGSIEAIECSFDTLPLIDDNGITGMWSPGHRLENFVGQAITFTFTPDDPSVSPESLLITVEDESLLQNFGRQPDLVPMFCNATDETHDFIELFQLQYSDYRLEVQGDIYLFDFIPPGSSAFVEDFATQFRSISVKDVPPQQNLRFSVTGYTNCGSEPLTKEFYIHIIGPFDPIRIDTALCAGDIYDFGGYKIYQDTTIFGEDACDTMLTATITRLNPTTTSRSEGISAACGEGVYYYDTIVNNRHIGFVKAPLTAAPPYGPNYDTLFTETTLGNYVLPFPNAAGCDSIQRLNFSIGRSDVTRIAFDLCASRDTIINVGNSNIRVDRRTPYYYLPTSGCSFIEIEANILYAEIDSLPHETLCASEVRTVEVSPGNFMNFDASMTYPFTVDLNVGTNGCPATYTVDFTFIQPTRGSQFVRLCPGETYSLGGQNFNQATQNTDVLLAGAASTGCDSIVELTIEMITPDIIDVNQTICPEEVFNVEGTSFDFTNDSGSVSVLSTKGCDSIIYNVNLDFFQVNDIVIDPLICADEVISLPEYNTVIDAQNLTQDLITTSADGCLQNVVIRASIYDPITSEFDIAICAGEVYNYAGEDRSQSGAYTETLTATSTGCDSVVTLNLTVRDEIPVTNDGIISECEGLPITYLGSVYRDAGTYSELLVSENGCDSLVTFEILFDPVIREDIGVTMTCPGEAVTMYNQTYTDEGIYETTLQTSDGCDSIVTFEIDFFEIVTTDLGTLTSCSFVPLDFLGNTYVTEGQYSETITSSDGCDSILTFTFEYLPELSGDAGVMMTCPGTPVNFLNEDFSDEGVFQRTIQNADGCDSIVTFEIDFFEVITTDLGTLTSCSFVPLTFLGNTYATEGQYSETITSSDGCDSILTFTFEYLPELSGDAGIMMTCPGTPVNFLNEDFSDEGVYQRTIQNANGCDSIVTFEIDFFEVITTDLGTLTSCSFVPLDFLGNTYATEGQYSETITSSDGCDSILTFTFEYLPELSGDAGVMMTCPGTPVNFLNEDFSDEGVYQRTIQNADGCDSIVTFEVDFFEIVTTDLGTLTSCSFVPLTFLGNTYVTEGQYSETVTSSDGCDSILTFTFEYLPELSGDAGVMMTCPGTPVNFLNEDFSDEGVYQRTIQNANGCDSIVTFEIDFFETPTTDLGVFESCAELPVEFLGTTYPDAGDYSVILPSADGCDSTVTFSVNYRPQEIIVEALTLCPGEQHFVFNNAYAAPSDTIITNPGGASDGCDSTVHLILTFHEQIETEVTYDICEGGAINVGDITFSAPVVDEPVYFDASNGCDSIVMVTINVIENSIEDLGKVELCEGEGHTVGDTTLFDEGQHTLTYTGAMGCDSLVYIEIERAPEVTSTINAIMCYGESMIFNGKSFSQSGIYFDTMRSARGCDSIITINLEILDEIPVTRLSDQSICLGGSYDFNNESYTNEGDHFVDFITPLGCDSTVVFNLSFETDISNTIFETSCSNMPFQFEGQIFTATGMYPIYYPRPGECDSVVMLDLTVMDSYEEDLGIVEICEGSSLDVGGFILNEEQAYTIPLSSVDGCDSMVSVQIVFTQAIMEDLGTITLCDGDSFDFGTLNITQSGTYRDTTASAGGCDSITTIRIEMTPLLVVTTNSIIGSCEGGANGSFVIEGIPGAAPPFSVFGLPGVDEIDALPFTINGLEAGDYDFDIEDANGCLTSGQVTISNDRSSALTITYTEIDPTGLYEITILYEGDIVSIEWEDIPGLSCYDCPNPSVEISETTTFTVTVVDAEGCISTSSITLFVDEIGKVYFPNVINPNSYQGNHRFFPQIDNNDGVTYDLYIFDRWGNKIYEEFNMPANDIGYGWNGRYANNRINAGVFVYKATLYKPNGIEESFKGDITVIE